MAFVLKGEVQIDGSKATAGLRGVQQQATKTANTFRQSDANAQKLEKHLSALALMQVRLEHLLECWLGLELAEYIESHFHCKKMNLCIQSDLDSHTSQ